MPADPYCESGNRYRRHSRFVLLPWLDLLVPRPITQYLQDRELNSKDGGMVRTFERLGGAMESNEFLRELILFDFHHTTFPEAARSMPMDVGIHAIRYVTRPGLPGISSPEGLHKDGEPYTYIHLIARCRVTGGESLVADNDKRSLATTSLMDCLDTVAVSDKDVYHAVTTVEVAPGETEGHRDVLLIDFTPMHPMILKAPSRPM
ncbi:MAG: 2OG-Fe dioxygenase family protein [Armatimonadetes bacterium]|nr:2OG-Fe dioxygenase family protein [Armatimonadota bacterium]